MVDVAAALRLRRAATAAERPVGSSAAAELGLLGCLVGARSGDAAHSGPARRDSRTRLLGMCAAAACQDVGLGGIGPASVRGLALLSPPPLDGGPDIDDLLANVRRSSTVPLYGLVPRAMHQAMPIMSPLSLLRHIRSPTLHSPSPRAAPEGCGSGLCPMTSRRAATPRLPGLLRSLRQALRSPGRGGRARPRPKQRRRRHGLRSPASSPPSRSWWRTSKSAGERRLSWACWSARWPRGAEASRSRRSLCVGGRRQLSAALSLRALTAAASLTAPVRRLLCFILSVRGQSVSCFYVHPLNPPTLAPALLERAVRALLPKGGELPPELAALEPEIVERVVGEILQGGHGKGLAGIAGLQEAKRVIQEEIVWPIARPEL